ncbi:MAG: TonB-dependent siderophore receptor, partial [Comamonadaceae bacterium]
VQAGGQVARGGDLGMLGQVGLMDAPFSLTSYTAKTIADQQARSIADAISRNDPSVRLDYGDGTSVDALYIRGFPLVNDEMSLNGLPGILGQYRVATEFIERAEVLKGPSALLNGISPGGSVGGSINIVPKRAPQEPLNRVTVSHMSSSVWGAGVDLGRRFGEDKAWGIRVNAAARDGATARDHLSDQSRMASVGLDYRRDRVRASLDVISQRQSMFGARGTVSLDNQVGAPAAPDGRRNFAQPWNVQKSIDNTVMGKLEVDLAENLTAFAALGTTHDRTEGIVSNPATVSRNGDFGFFSIPIDWRQKTTSGQVGLRGQFQTGPVLHQWSAVASSVRRDSRSLFDFSGLSGNAGSSNIDRPVLVPDPVVVSRFADPYAWEVATR